MNTEKRADPLSILVHELSKLPTIGEKSAMRLAMHILKAPKAQADALSEAIQNVKSGIRMCESCFSFTQDELCAVCADPKRNDELIAVVETQSDMVAIERTSSFNGKYHVLHGVLSPLDGVGPEDLKIRELLKRIENKTTAELILATNPSVEGEATAMYIAKLVCPEGTSGAGEGRNFIKTTRLAYGLPVGGVLEYADRMSIGKAFENRVPLG